MWCTLEHVRISLSSELSGDDGDVELFVGRQSVTLGHRGLCSVVNSVGG